MDQQEIIKIIEANPKLSFEEMKKEAQDIGLNMKLFNLAWEAANGENKRWLKNNFFKRLIRILVTLFVVTLITLTALIILAPTLKIPTYITNQSFINSILSYTHGCTNLDGNDCKRSKICIAKEVVCGARDGFGGCFSIESAKCVFGEDLYGPYSEG